MLLIWSWKLLRLQSITSSYSAAILLPDATNILKKKRISFKAEEKNEVLKILSHCDSSATLDLGVMEIERLYPKFNGLTTRKIEMMWRLNEGK